MSTKKELLALCQVLGINNTRLKSLTKDQIKDEIKQFKLISKQNNILDQGKIIKYIYHTADLHIRTLERHQEYKQVFNNLFNELKVKQYLSDSVLVICGDIFHNRDKLVSETIILFNELIEKMCSIIDVIIILGNHDTYSHNDRLDIITGIVSLKNIPNFYFLKESGIYKYHNLSFYVSSLFDNKFIRCPKIKANPDDINISLYHGPVYGCKLDNGSNFTGDTIKLSDFNYFDLVLLGDIHKRQFLKENIAYPGSLIQQNHKEEDLHGILEWELNSQEIKSKFIQIANEYGFKSVFLSKELELIGANGNLIDINYFTKYSYIKLYHHYFQEFDINKIKEQLKTFTQIMGFVKEIKISKQNDTKGTEVIDIPKEINYFDKYISSNLTNVPDDIKNQLIKLHNKYDCNNSEIVDSNTWYIKTLEFKNIFIYGNDHLNKINFDDKLGVIGILGGNAIGKSAIFNIILYCLFGNIYKSKNYSNRNIINKKSNNFYIKMTILKGDTIFIIERKGKNKKRTGGELSMEETINFYKDTSNYGDNEAIDISGNGIINLTDSNKITTANLIKETLNLSTKESFLLTNVTSYTNYTSLLNMTNSEISSKFTELFNLSKYTDIYSEILKINKDLSDSIKLKSSKLQDYKVTTLDLQIALDKLNNMKNQSENTIQEINKLQNEIELIIKQEIDIGKLNNNYDTTFTLEEYKKIEMSLLDMPLLDRLDYEIKDDLEHYSIQYNTIEFNKENLIFIENNNTVEELTNQLNLQKSKIKKIKVIDQDDYNKAIKKEHFDPELFIEDLINSKQNNEIILDSDLYEDLLDFLNVIKSKEYLHDSILISEYKEYKQNLAYNKKIKSEIDILENKLMYVLDKKIKELNNELKQNKLYELKCEMEKYFELHEKLELKQELINKKIQFRSELTKLQLNLNDQLRKINTLEIEIKQKTKELKIIECLTNELNQLNKNLVVYKLYKGIIKNLPKLILSETLKKIEIQVNKLTYKLTGLYLLFHINEESENYEILIKKENMILGTEHLSGAERFIFNVIIKLVIDKFKYFDKASFFIIDECCDSMSEENIINKMDDLFDILKKEYSNILIISHNNDLKKMVDHKIEIESNGICSNIR